MKKRYMSPAVLCSSVQVQSGIMDVSNGTDDNFAKGRSGDYEWEDHQKDNSDYFADGLW